MVDDQHKERYTFFIFHHSQTKVVYLTQFPQPTQDAIQA